MAFSSARAHDFLLKHFGYSAFRNGQMEVIQSIADGHDTLVIMPTGGGKSLCYQIPALLHEGVAVVVSPLIALMKDQVDALARANVRAAFINSTLGFHEIRQRLHDARFGKYKLLYVAPERLESKEFLEALQKIPLSFLAVDEAHCVSEWGHDFRPSYLHVATANETLGRLPVIALTATATPEVQDDIARHLQMRAPQRFIRGFNRPNLHYHVLPGKSKIPSVLSIVEESKGSNIIYCASRKRVEDIATALRSHRLPAEAYHGGMADGTRQSVQERFIDNQCKTIVATNAFGMGVDKSDVRHVIHCDMTLSLEAYYQEAGRAGRDGEESTCSLLYAPSDRGLQEFFINSTFPDHAMLAKVYAFLYDFHATPIGLKAYAPVLVDDIQIANRTGVHISVVTTALGLFERAEILRRGSTHGMAGIQITTSRERIHEYYNNTQVPERRTALMALLRTVGAEALERPVQFDLNDVTRKHDITLDNLLNAIRAFEYARIVRYEPPGATGGLQLLMERMPFARLPLKLDQLAIRRERAVKKLDTVQRYAETRECKRNFLLQYFQEYDTDGECGTCSSCTEAQRVSISRSPRRTFLLHKILQAVAELDGRFGRTVVVDVAKGSRTQKTRNFNLAKASTFGCASEFTRQEITEELDSAIAERLVQVSADLYPTISLSEHGRRTVTNEPAPMRFRYAPVVENRFPALLNTCLAIRKDIATRENISEQAVIDEAMLLELVNALPRTQKDIANAVQVGQIFISRFASAFLRAIQAYTAAEQESNTAETPLPKRVLASVALARDGYTLRQIAETRNLTPGTVSQHLQEAIELGIELNRQQFIDNSLYEKVRDFLRHRKLASLRDIRSSLEIDCDYADLRIATAFAREDMKAQGL